MKSILTYVLTFMVLSLVIALSLDARGGRGGGGRGMGGVGAGGYGINRSPSMSRSRNIPQEGFSGSSLRQHSESRVNNYLKIPEASTPISNRRPDLGGQRIDRGDSVRDQVRQDRPNLGNSFDDREWKNLQWRGVNRWLGWPYGGYYYYDDGGYYYDDSGSAATNGSSAGTEPAYTNGASEPQDVAYVEQSEEWIPLGVFAMTHEGKTGETPTIFLQLSVNKQGTLSGKYLITTTEKTYPVVGLVDKKSQRAAWQMEGSDNVPIAETALYNLTENEAPVRIKFSDGRSQNWLLVRVNKEK